MAVVELYTRLAAAPTDGEPREAALCPRNLYCHRETTLLTDHSPQHTDCLRITERHGQTRVAITPRSKASSWRQRGVRIENCYGLTHCCNYVQMEPAVTTHQTLERSSLQTCSAAGLRQLSPSAAGAKASLLTPLNARLTREQYPSSCT